MTAASKPREAVEIRDRGGVGRGEPAWCLGVMARLWQQTTRGTGPYVGIRTHRVHFAAAAAATAIAAICRGPNGGTAVFGRRRGWLFGIAPRVFLVCIWVYVCHTHAPYSSTMYVRTEITLK